MRTTGILGGMGPEATVLLMQRLIAATPAQDDADHIPLIVHQNPQVPSRIRFLVEGQGTDPAPVLAQMARDLTVAGAQALAMPCNTAHAFAGAIRAASPLPFLDMRDATLPHLPPGARLGMLASPAVRLTGAFDAHLAAAGITPVWPQDARPLALIRRIKRGETGAALQADFVSFAQDQAAVSDHLLVACTEFSLLTPALHGLRWTDSLDCLVTAIADFARGA